MNKTFSSGLSAVACVLIGMITSSLINEHRAKKAASIETRLQSIETRIQNLEEKSLSKKQLYDLVVGTRDNAARSDGMADKIDHQQIRIDFMTRWLRELSTNGVASETARPDPLAIEHQ